MNPIDLQRVKVKRKCIFILFVLYVRSFAFFLFIYPTFLFRVPFVCRSEPSFDLIMN